MYREVDHQKNVKLFLDKLENIKFIKNNSKILLMNDFILSIHKKRFIDQNDIEKIKHFAMSEGGFITNSIRKFFWMKIFLIKNKNNQLFNDNQIQRLEFKRIEDNNGILSIVNVNEIISKKFPNSNENQLIDKDINRSILHTIKNEISDFNLTTDTSNFISDKLTIINKTIFNLDKFKYSYYQGYHDLSLYIYLLFSEDLISTIKILQMMNELFLQDFVNDLPMEEVTLSIQKTIELIDSKVYRDLVDRDEINTTYLCMKWVICLFTHTDGDFMTICRILDYIFLSSPNTIYHIVANVSLKFYFRYLLKNIKKILIHITLVF